MDISLKRVRETWQEVIDEYGLTIVFALLLIVWYELQFYVLFFFGVDIFQWLLTFESVTDPTPGWVLATLTHGDLTHLGFNVAILLVFGGIAERHMSRPQYLTFFFVVGTAASFANLVFWPEDAPSVGASGAIFGLIGYSLYHHARNHEENLFPMSSSPDGVFEPERTLLLSVTIGIGFPLIIIQTGLQLTGVLDAGRSAVGAHGCGFLLGVLYEYWQPFFGGRGCE